MDIEKLRPRFLEKVERIPGIDCWLWTGAIKNKSGHGVMGMGLPKKVNKLIPAHRLSYLLFNGSIPGGLEIRHTCDVASCVNPEHLIPGTHQDNLQDARERGQLGKGRNSGEMNGSNCKLTTEQVLAIRDDPRTTTKLGEIYGVSSMQISLIKRRKRWAHL